MSLTRPHDINLRNAFFSWEINLHKTFLLPIPEMLSVFQIVQVGLMTVGLLLKTDMEIGFLPVSVLEEQEPPLYAVPDEERDIQKLFLLCGMNQLMVQLRCGQWAHGKDEAKQADG
jgi:hypothetical protein